MKEGLLCKNDKKIKHKDLNRSSDLIPLEYTLSKFQVVQTTASLCHNVVLHKKVKKTTKSQKKRGLATTIQPQPDFSKTCGFCEVLCINEDCLDTKFHQNCWSRF